MKIVALHGFLGKASDWSLISKTVFPRQQVDAMDLWPSIRAHAGHASPFEAWADHFAKLYQAQTPIFAVGYSFGGRLLMSAVVKYPELFSGVVFVSSSPGLQKEIDRQSRRENDELWADSFRQEAWDECLSMWDAQPVLAPPKNPGPDFVKLNRAERDFDRNSLALALTGFSLGRQNDYREGIRTSKVPMLFLAGEEDMKFVKLAQELGSSSFFAIKNAGHRTPWDAPKAVGEAIQAWPVYRSLIAT